MSQRLAVAIMNSRRNIVTLGAAAEKTLSMRNVEVQSSQCYEIGSIKSMVDSFGELAYNEQRW